MFPIGAIPHLILWLKESTTIYGFGLVLGGALGVYSSLLSPDAGASLIGAGLPLLLPNNSPLYGVIKGRIPQITATLQSKNFSTLFTGLYTSKPKKEIIMTNPTIQETTTTQTATNTSNTGNDATALANSIESVVTRIIEALDGGNLTPTQTQTLALLKAILVPLISEAEDYLGKRFDVQGLINGTTQILNALEQIETGYKTIRDAVKSKTA